MNQNTVTGDYININLRQLGATSITVSYTHLTLPTNSRV